MSNHWVDSDDPRRFQRGLFGATAWWIVGFVALISLIGAVLYWTGVIFAEPKGRADAYKQQRSGANRIAQQAQFEDRFQDIQSTDRKLTQAAKDAESGDPTAKTVYTGLLNYCSDAVAEYNAESRKYLAADFKSIDLPHQIDQSDPTTDCKPEGAK